MTESAVQITSNDISEDRFSRLRLLGWWDQERIRKARVLVVGAGALGNEILKNLALLGFERVVVVDLDSIEASNLSRTVLYRDSDIGRGKAAAASAAFQAIYNKATVQPLRANILFDVGLGLFDWADIILAGLDNREARLWINRCAWKVGKPWFDGAIEGLSGLARVFLPGQPPCYECTLGETDWAILDRRMSCNLLTADDTLAGKVPTTPTTSAVIAGIQVQEAMKYLHGLPVLAGKAFVFDGMHHTSYVVEYTENPDCWSHHQFEEIVRLPLRSNTTTLAALHARAKADLVSMDVTLEFSRDVIYQLICPACGHHDEIFAAVGSVTTGQARCPHDGSTRGVVAIHSFNGTEAFGARTLDTLGLPPWDIFTARSESREIGYVLAGDAPQVLELFHGEL
ncbi:MAG: ThiF family adenylyltransferase [Bryobacteraceae bacterium]